MRIKGKMTIIISIISMVFGIISICISAWRSPELSFDYQGVIVGVLSMLVTVLIAWNIYSLIDIKRIKEELIASKNMSVFNAERNNLLTCHSIGDFYYYILIGSDPLGVEYQFLYYRISEIFHASNIGDIGTCNVIVQAILEMIVNPEHIKINHESRNRILSLLTKVNRRDEIIGYDDLVAVIARLGVSV